MLVNRGTPKTLNEAVQNGLMQAVGKDANEAVKVIEAHVRDFLSQHLQVAYFRVDMEHWSTEDILNAFASKANLKYPPKAG